MRHPLVNPYRDCLKYSSVDKDGPDRSVINVPVKFSICPLTFLFQQLTFVSGERPRANDTLIFLNIKFINGNSSGQKYKVKL